MIIMKFKTFVRTTTISLMVLLSACSSNVQHLVIAPDILTASNNLLSTRSINISTSDLRAAQHMLQIVKEDQAAQLITSQSSLAEIVDKAFTSAYKTSGAQVTPSGNNVLNIVINNALINVNQSFFTYNANSTIVLSATIDNGVQTLTKTYRSSGKSEGPIKADIAVLERDFNQLLSKLITSIVNDPQIIEFMR